MLKFKIIIIGFGFVGKFIKQIFFNADIFDKSFGLIINSGIKIPIEDIKEYLSENDCKWDLAIISVPTPGLDSGKCDISEVESVIQDWKEFIKNFLIKSTIAIGTTDYLREKYKVPIVFSPEYIGETPNHPMSNLSVDKQFLIFGGIKDDINSVLKIYNNFITSDIKIYQVDAKTAELCKYMENSFLAMKVLFVNEFYEIAKTFNVDYNKLREIWLADYRIGDSHTLVFDNNRGFGGKCFPKDLSAIIHSSEKNGFNPELLKNLVVRNLYYREMNN